MRLRSGLVIGVAVLALAAGCGDDDGDGKDQPGIANPASVFCEAQGGRVENVEDSEGNQQGFCVLPDGTRVDEWEYYRANSGE